MKPSDMMVQSAQRLLAGATRGVDLGDEVEANTPARMAKALGELLDGYDADLASMCTTFPAPSEDVVIVRDIPFSSMCEHHVLPFRGVVSIAYVPDGRIIGLSKIPRIVRAFSRRLQVQERLTFEVAQQLDKVLTPKGVLVVVEGVHSCAELRGIETRAEMVTSHCRGLFREDATLRAEAMALLKR